LEVRVKFSPTSSPLPLTFEEKRIAPKNDSSGALGYFMEPAAEIRAKKPPLYSVQLASGAKFIEVNGRLLAARFTDPVKENLAVRNNAGVMDLSNRGYLKIVGPDRTSFLQGIITNDVGSIKPGMGLHAAILTIKGRVIADFIISAFEDHFILETEASITEKLLNTFSRYKIREKISIEQQQDLGSIGLQGPNSPSILARAVKAALPDLENYEHTQLRCDQDLVTIRRESVTGETGYILTLSQEGLPRIWEKLLKPNLEPNLLPVGYEAAESLRVEAGLPRYGLDLTEENIPLEIENEDMVSFTKGCYVGQEVVARLKFLGQANKHLKGLLITDTAIPTLSARITSEDKEVGRITSSAYSPTLKQPIAMAYIRREYSTAGTQVKVESDGRILSATVADLPFIKR
jgi:glycine cleavage system T protein (aminomethyltransferase)